MRCYRCAALMRASEVDAGAGAVHRGGPVVSGGATGVVVSQWKARCAGWRRMKLEGACALRRSMGGGTTDGRRVTGTAHGHEVRVRLRHHRPDASCPVRSARRITQALAEQQ